MMRWFMNILIMLIQIPSGISKIKAESDRNHLWLSNSFCTHISEVCVSPTKMLCSQPSELLFIRHAKPILMQFDWIKKGKTEKVYILYNCNRKYVSAISFRWSSKWSQCGGFSRNSDRVLNSQWLAQVLFLKVNTCIFWSKEVCFTSAGIWRHFLLWFSKGQHWYLFCNNIYFTNYSNIEDFKESFQPQKTFPLIGTLCS